MSSHSRHGDKGLGSQGQGKEQECWEEWHLHPHVFAAIALSAQTLLASLSLSKGACTYKFEQAYMNAHLNGFPHATHLIMWDFKHHYKVAAGMQLLLGCYCHHCWFGFTYYLTKLKLYSHTDYIITVPCSFFQSM